VRKFEAHRLVVVRDRESSPKPGSLLMVYRLRKALAPGARHRRPRAPERNPDLMLAPSKANLPPNIVTEPQSDLVRGVFDPPSGLLPTALARYKVPIAVVAVLCALAGLAIGLARKPVYTASATVQVGQVNPNSPGFFGYVQSSASLATAFSRTIDAEPVLKTVGANLGLRIGEATARLSAAPIPESPTFRIIATGATLAGAIDLANVASSAVIAYIGESNSANPEANVLLQSYRGASIKLHEAAKHLALLSRKRARQTELSTAEANRNAAGLELKAASVAYTQAVTSQAPRTGLVSLLAGATSAKSDRRSKADLCAFVGLAIGLILGCAVAIGLQRRRAHKSAAAG
jgi:hypothetical protein